MIEGRSVLAVVPARGGSKGIPRKNLRTVRGRPLVALVGDVVRDVPEIDRSVISTDDPEIARVAKDAGLDAPFLRPDNISGDSATAFEAVAHALTAIEARDGCVYDIVVLLEPTSPLRAAGHVSAAIAALVVQKKDSIWTVSLTDTKYHPMKQLALNDGVLVYDHPQGPNVTARQQLKPVYHRNGIAYAMTRDCIVNQRSLMGRNAGALVVEGEHISIDTEWDIALVEWLLARRLGKMIA